MENELIIKGWQCEKCGHEHKPWLNGFNEKFFDGCLITFEQYAEIHSLTKKTIYNRFKNGTLNETIIYKGKQPLIKIEKK
jgi:hypothetical protein